MPEKEKKKYNPQVIFGFMLLIILLFFLGSSIWSEYKNSMMDNQEEQLLIISQSLGSSLGVSLENYSDGAKYLANKEERGTLTLDEAEAYINSREDFVENIIWYDSNKKQEKSVYEIQVEDKIQIAEVSKHCYIYQIKKTDESYFLEFQYFLEDGRSIGLLIDEEKYYQRLIQDIKIGSNGYVMIKSSDGIIVMHPDKKQWGIHVIEGRRKLYPDLDYESLEQMVREQESGRSGISIYNSYWWTKEDIPEVKKISAYAPANIGEDFLIVSAVLDYDDFYYPIAIGFMKVIFIMSMIFVIFGVLFVTVIRLLEKQRKAASEITYLKELNEVLEDVHRNEETIRHQQRLQIMGTMTGGIVHEFNNFLTPILGHAELLMMCFPEDSDEYDSANEIYEAAEKAKDVIRQISSLSRKNVETVYRQIDIKTLMRRFLKMSESVCPANIKTESQIMVEDNTNMLGNKTQINQVLLNVFVNAVQAIGKEDGVITVLAYCKKNTDFPEEILEKISGVWDEFVCIDIKDNGCGMDKETLSHIFDPFFTTKKAGKGTGLGLSLAEQIILSHRGYIYAESESGAGTVFHIVLPKSEEEEVRAGEITEMKYHGAFLIADDNMKVLEMLEQSLNKLNISTYSCKTKAEVKQQLKEKDVDAIFIDESLDDISGIELSLSLRSKYPDALIYLMVGVVTREVVEAKQNGIINAYIEKPVSDVELINAVRKEQNIDL